jgi:hypothetical protein
MPAAQRRAEAARSWSPYDWGRVKLLIDRQEVLVGLEFSPLFFTFVIKQNILNAIVYEYAIDCTFDTQN